MRETTAREVAEAGLAKPAPGSPCNRCGLCCLWEQCPLSLQAFGKAKRCPALEHTGEGYACGLITGGHPDLAMAAGQALGIGRGCDTTAPWD